MTGPGGNVSLCQRESRTIGSRERNCCERKHDMKKSLSVFGIFPIRARLESSVQELHRSGFRPADISVLAAENYGNMDIAVEKSTKLADGAAAGGIIGAIAGGTLGWLASSSVLVIPQLPQLNEVAAAGPIIASLAGVGAGALVAGIAGAVAGFRIPRYEAKRHRGRVRTGGLLLSVHCDDLSWAANARGILAYTGADSISQATESRADFGSTRRPVPRYPSEAFKPL